MKVIIFSFYLIVILAQSLLAQVNNSQRQFPQEAWLKYETPEDAGFSTKKLEKVRELYDSLGSAALFVVYNGNVLINWGETSRRFKCHSMRKSFLSALYGKYIDNGIIDTSKTLRELGIDDYPNQLTDKEKSARIVDLLSARSGIYLQAAYEPTRNLKPERGTYLPGTHWCYNNWDFNTLLTIFEQNTDKSIFDEFDEVFAKPLQMQDYNPTHGYYHYEKEKSIHPAYPFRMSARDLARLGLLFLNKGCWVNEQILSETYVDKSTSLISFDSTYVTGSGYGYMWWVNQAEPFRSLGMYSALGSGEHSIDVIPGADIVFVHRPDTYMWKRITYEDRRRLIKLVLDAKVTEPKKDARLLSIPFKDYSTNYQLMTAEEMEPYIGEYLNDGDRYPFLIEIINGVLKADFGEGKVNLYKIEENHFLIEDWNDDVYIIKNEDGEKELICIITLLNEGDYYLEKGMLNKANYYYKKAEKYYGADQRVSQCLHDLRKENEKIGLILE